MNEKTYERVIEYLKQQIKKENFPAEARSHLSGSWGKSESGTKFCPGGASHNGTYRNAGEQTGKGNFLVNMPQKSLGNVFSMMLLTGQSNYREVSRIRRILEQEAFVQAVR